MSAARGYFSPHFFANVDRKQDKRATTIIREGFSPRSRLCGACSSPCMTSPIRSYFCEACWSYVRRDYCPDTAR